MIETKLKTFSSPQKEIERYAGPLRPTEKNNQNSKQEINTLNFPHVLKVRNPTQIF